MRAVTIIAATLLGIACVLYRNRACVGCALIDIGARLLPDPEMPDDVDDFAAAVADTLARRSARRQYDYPEWCP